MGVIKMIAVLFAVLIAIPLISVYAEDGDETAAPRYLDAAFLDEILDFSDAISLPALALPEIPIVDPALDAVNEALPLDFELGFSVVSAYIWRGQNLGSDASFQPYVTVSPSFEPLGDLSFTYWVDITKNEPGKNAREFDFVVDYSFDFLEGIGYLGYDEEKAPYLLSKAFDFTFDTGYIYYKFPPQPDTKSQEVYWGVEYDMPLHPSFSIYNDWDRGRGIWYEWGISQDINVGVVTLATYATMGYNHKQWGTTSALSTLDFGVSMPVPLGTHMTIEPFLSYTKRLNPTYTDDGADLTHDELYGGMNWSITF